MDLEYIDCKKEIQPDSCSGMERILNEETREILSKSESGETHSHSGSGESCVATRTDDGDSGSADEWLGSDLKFEGTGSKFRKCDIVLPSIHEVESREKCVQASSLKNKTLSCCKCDKKFTKACLLDGHYKDVHGVDKPYQCWRCAFQTAEYLSMENHMDTCLEPLHCVECGDMFDNAQLLLEHKILEHLKNPTADSQIQKLKLGEDSRTPAKGKRVSLRLEKSTAKRAKYVEEEEEDFEDEVLPFKVRIPKVRRKKSRNKKVTKSSIEPELEKEETGSTLYLCPQTDTGCIYQTMSMNNLLKHLQTHEDGKSYSCPHKNNGCKYETKKRGNLRSHLKTHLRADRYKCEQDSCDFKCGNKSALARHMKTVHGLGESQEFKCNLCQKKFSRSQRLKAHLRVHSNEAPYICDQCGKCFASKQWMSVHQKIHHGTEKYICDICAKEFSAKTYLAKHVKTHDSTKKYLCDVCPKAFKRSDHLQCHKRMHTGEKPFQCAECGKTFKQICGLQAHKKVHSGEKPYVCSICARAFTYNSSLKGGLCNLCRPSVTAHAALQRAPQHSESEQAKRALSTSDSAYKTYRIQQIKPDFQTSPLNAMECGSLPMQNYDALPSISSTSAAPAFGSRQGNTPDSSYQMGPVDLAAAAAANFVSPDISNMPV